MSYRAKLSPRASRSLFRTGATRTVSKNISSSPMRGGIRL